MPPPVNSSRSSELLLTITWDCNPEQDRDNQYQESKERKAVFFDDSGQSVLVWRDKIR